MSDALQKLVAHALNHRCDGFDADQLAKARMILLDTLAVGVAGSRATFADALHQAARAWGSGGVCRVIGRGRDLPGPSAALLNAYQIHGQEFDCVHEPAVVHPMAAIVATALAEIEQLAGGRNETGVSGQAFMDTICAAVDVAIAVGLSARAGLRFFRPATAGAFGAAAVVCRLRGFDSATALETFGHMYSQLCGTMQAHTEGKAVLPIQIGFNARNAVISGDLASAGISAPHDILTGPYGYLTLFEPGGDIEQAMTQLESAARITELSYKPFPTGRATHGGLDGIASLHAQYGFDASQVKQVQLFGPPLIHRLVARPIQADLTPNYARLCMQYVGAVALTNGTVGLFDFDQTSLRASPIHALAQHIQVIDDNNPDPNALVPQRVQISLDGGKTLSCELTEVIGSPARPMDHAQNLAKVRHCCEFAGLPQAQTEGMIELGMELETLTDIGQWLALAWRPEIA